MRLAYRWGADLHALDAARQKVREMVFAAETVQTLVVRSMEWFAEIDAAHDAFLRHAPAAHTSFEEVRALLLRAATLHDEQLSFCRVVQRDLQWESAANCNNNASGGVCVACSAGPAAQHVYYEFPELDFSQTLVLHVPAFSTVRNPARDLLHECSTLDSLRDARLFARSPAATTAVFIGARRGSANSAATVAWQIVYSSFQSAADFDAAASPLSTISLQVPITTATDDDIFGLFDSVLLSSTVLVRLHSAIALHTDGTALVISVNWREQNYTYAEIAALMPGGAQLYHSREYFVPWASVVPLQVITFAATENYSGGSSGFQDLAKSLRGEHKNVRIESVTEHVTFAAPDVTLADPIASTDTPPVLVSISRVCPVVTDRWFEYIALLGCFYRNLHAEFELHRAQTTRDAQNANFIAQLVDVQVASRQRGLEACARATTASTATSSR